MRVRNTPYYLLHTINVSRWVQTISEPAEKGLPTSFAKLLKLTRSTLVFFLPHTFTPTPITLPSYIYTHTYHPPIHTFPSPSPSTLSPSHPHLPIHFHPPIHTLHHTSNLLLPIHLCGPLKLSLAVVFSNQQDIVHRVPELRQPIEFKMAVLHTGTKEAVWTRTIKTGRCGLVCTEEGPQCPPAAVKVPHTLQLYRMVPNCGVLC